VTKGESEAPAYPYLHSPQAIGKNRMTDKGRFEEKHSQTDGGK